MTSQQYLSVDCCCNECYAIEKGTDRMFLFLHAARPCQFSRLEELHSLRGLCLIVVSTGAHVPDETPDRYALLGTLRGVIQA